MISKSQANLFKNAVFMHLDNHIKVKAPLPISWECQYCYENHSMNLLENVAKVEMNYNATIAQPHLALLDEKENIVIAIDFPSKKLPANAALIYIENYIIYIQILLDKKSDIKNIGEMIYSPSFVSLCLNPSCPDCGKHLHKKQIIVATTDCWSCEAPMKFAYWTAGGRYGTPADFDAADIEFAASKGVRFTSQHSPFQNEYNANTCNSCGKHIGDFYLHDYYGSVPAETFEVGYYCVNCTEAVLDMYKEPDGNDAD